MSASSDDRSDDDGGSQDASSDEEEDPRDYRRGGYHPVTVGDRFNNGRYTVLSKMGWGHFSTVWLSWDSRTELPVALKVQKSAKRYSDAAKDEVELLRQVARSDPGPLGHHVVLMHDNFIHRGVNGMHHVMTFEVLGDNLLSLIKATRYKGLPMAVVRSLARAVLLGLDHLHRRLRIIHTDLKPENVLCMPSPRQMQALVASARAQLEAVTQQQQAAATAAASALAADLQVGCAVSTDRPATAAIPAAAAAAASTDSAAAAQQAEEDGAGAAATLSKNQKKRLKKKLKQQQAKAAATAAAEAGEAEGAADDDEAGDHAPHVDTASTGENAAATPSAKAAAASKEAKPSAAERPPISAVSTPAAASTAAAAPAAAAGPPAAPAAAAASPAPAAPAVAGPSRGLDLEGPLDFKVVDLGNACWRHHHFTADIQTRQYRCPEVIIDSGYDTPADMWSLACVLFEAATGDLLFDPRSGKTFSRDEDHLALCFELLGKMPKKLCLGGRMSKEFFNKQGELRSIRDLHHRGLASVLAATLPTCAVADADAFAAFLLPMLEYKPERRATAEQLLEHGWLDAESTEASTPAASAAAPAAAAATQEVTWSTANDDAVRTTSTASASPAAADSTEAAPVKDEPAAVAAERPATAPAAPTATSAPVLPRVAATPLTAPIEDLD